MYPFPHAISPALRSHVDAQTSYLNDISKSLFRSFQQMVDLNIQLTQTMLEESALVGKQVVSADRQSELLSAATSRAQPASDKLRAYQQHITRLAADAQVDLARVTEHHGQTTARTARVLADEVARDATEQTERGLRAQQETVRQYADPFVRGDGAGSQQASAQSGISSGSAGNAFNAQTGNSDGSASIQSSPTEKQPVGQNARSAAAH